MDYRNREFLLGHVRSILDFYAPNIVDLSGGFFQNFTDDGSVFDPGARHLVSSCRMVVNYCRAYELFGDDSFLELAQHERVDHRSVLPERIRESDDGEPLTIEVGLEQLVLEEHRTTLERHLCEDLGIVGIAIDEHDQVDGFGQGAQQSDELGCSGVVHGVIDLVQVTGHEHEVRIRVEDRVDGPTLVYPHFGGLEIGDDTDDDRTFGPADSEAVRIDDEPIRLDVRGPNPSADQSERGDEQQPGDDGRAVLPIDDQREADDQERDRRRHDHQQIRHVQDAESIESMCEREHDDGEKTDQETDHGSHQKLSDAGTPAAEPCGESAGQAGHDRNDEENRAEVHDERLSDLNRRFAPGGTPRSLR